MRQSRKLWIGLAIAALASLVVGAIKFDLIRQKVQQWQYERSAPTSQTIAEIPDALPQAPNELMVDSPEPTLTAVTPEAPLSIPSSLNRTVPFTSQAPTGNWDQHHEEYCEEASALIVGRYFQGRQISSSDDAEAGLLELERWEMEHLGYFESTTAQETATMITDVYGISATVVSEVTVEGMKRALAEGALVTLPTAGRLLKNPYFKQPGPIYHMLVVKGFTANEQFITNDPGTKRGADFVYPADRLLNAVGDYNHNDPAHGQKVMIVVGPK